MKKTNKITKLFKVLGDETRYHIFELLLKRKHCVRSLAHELGISESAVSQALKKMKEVELVCSENFGYHTHFSINEKAIDLLMKELLGTKEKLNIATNKKCKCHAGCKRCD